MIGCQLRKEVFKKCQNWSFDLSLGLPAAAPLHFASAVGRSSLRSRSFQNVGIDTLNHHFGTPGFHALSLLDLVCHPPSRPENPLQQISGSSPKMTLKVHKFLQKTPLFLYLP